MLFHRSSGLHAHTYWARWIMKRLASISLALSLVIFAGVETGWAEQSVASHALALHGQPKYGPDFKQLDYVNPEAPEGGAVRLAQIGTFDSLNPYILKGVAQGMVEFLANAIETPAVVSTILHPLKVANRDTAGIRQNVREHDDSVLREDLIC